MLTRERLIELLSYDQATGAFTWRNGRRGTAAGSPAGSVTRFGYISIRIDQVAHYAHRLAVLYVEGRWPTADVDHIDAIKSNNAYSNLREVSHRTNQQNRRGPNRRATGRSSAFLGVSWKKSHSKWAANIQGEGGKLKFLGYFETETAAHDVYVTEKRRIHEGNTL